MKLLTKKLRKKLPSLYSTEKEEDPLVICKYFLPGSHWTWFALEFDGEDIFFGWVYGDFPELGYFRLSELEKLRAPITIRMEGKSYTHPRALAVERDLHFKPRPLSEVQRTHEQ